MGRLAEAVDDAAGLKARQEIADHEERLHPHRIRPPRTGPLTAIPFAGVDLDDEQLASAMEWMEPYPGSNEEPIDMRTAAYRLGTSILVLQRCLAEFAPRWRKLVAVRTRGIEPPPFATD